jgi:hypothetical protein
LANRDGESRDSPEKRSMILTATDDYSLTLLLLLPEPPREMHKAGQTHDTVGSVLAAKGYKDHAGHSLNQLLIDSPFDHCTFATLLIVVRHYVFMPFLVVGRRWWVV